MDHAYWVLVAGLVAQFLCMSLRGATSILLCATCKCMSIHLQAFCICLSNKRLSVLWLL